MVNPSADASQIRYLSLEALVGLIGTINEVLDLNIHAIAAVCMMSSEVTQVRTG